MAANPKNPLGPPMDLANMREQGVRSLIAFASTMPARHQAVIICRAIRALRWCRGSGPR
jgi:hypothetical protein